MTTPTRNPDARPVLRGAAFALALVAVVAAFSPLLRAPFLYDDHRVILGDEAIAAPTADAPDGLALLAAYAAATFAVSRHYRDPVEYWAYAARQNRASFLAALDRKMREFCRRAALQYVPARDALGPNEDGAEPYDAVSGNHLSRSGVERLAAAIAKTLQEKESLSAK